MSSLIKDKIHRLLSELWPLNLVIKGPRTVSMKDCP